MNPWLWLLALYFAPGLYIATSFSRYLLQHIHQYPALDNAGADFRRRAWFLTAALVVVWPIVIIGFLALEFRMGRRWISWVTRISDEELPAPSMSGSLDTLAPGPKWWRHTATRLAHYQPLLLVGAVVVNTMNDYGVGVEKGALILASLAALGAIIVSIFAETHHDRQLCHRCAAATPLDGKSVAERRASLLRFFHWSIRRPWRIALLFLFALFVDITVHPGPGVYYPLYLFWAATGFSALRHRPLEPWCPQCRWRDGDEDDETIAPPPVPINQGHR